MKKLTYFPVRRAFQFVLVTLFSTFLSKPLFAQSSNCVTDNGGVNGNYTSKGVDYHVIQPCGAKKITLTFSQFKVANIGELMKIYDGPNAAGKPLHPGTGFTKGNEPKGPIIAYSGAMYIYFSSSGSDSGYVACWTSDGDSLPPVASFEIPDSLINSVNYTYKNTSKNVASATDYVWSINPDYDNVGYSKDLNFAILKNNKYDVTLKTTTCLGKNTYTKSVVVLGPFSKTTIDFDAKNLRPMVGKLDTLNAKNTISINPYKANRFRWMFSPPTVTYVNGTSSSTQNIQVKFNAKGKYTISLQGWNSLDSANSFSEVLKTNYIIVEDLSSIPNDPNFNPNVHIYPNPNSGNFTIKIDNPEKDISIEIYNLVGEKIKVIETATSLSIYPIDLKTIVNGIYVVKVKNGGMVYNQKIIVTK